MALQTVKTESNDTKNLRNSAEGGSDAVVSPRATSHAKSTGISQSISPDAYLKNNNHLDHAGYEIDVLSQFRANLSHVENLAKRLHFTINEVRGALKSR